MNTYTPKTPRVALGFAAAAMAATTMAVMVVLPAGLEAAPVDEAATLATAAAADAFIARRILDAEEMEREDEAEHAALAMPAPCLHPAEPDAHGS